VFSDEGTQDVIHNLLCVLSCVQTATKYTGMCENTEYLPRAT